MVNDIDTSINKYQSIHEVNNKSNLKVLSQEDLNKLIVAKNIPKEEIQKITDEMNKIVTSKDFLNMRVELRINESINRVIITVYDRETNELVREIPCKEIQNLAFYLKEEIGILYDRQV